MMRQAIGTRSVRTRGRGFYEITRDVQSDVQRAGTVDLSIPIAPGRLCLGTWQGIYVWEHRTAPHANGDRPRD